MDRIEFLHSINMQDSSIIDFVVNFFDQYMLLYDLVDCVCKPTVLEYSTTHILFNLVYNDKHSASLLADKVNASSMMPMYGHMYNVTCNLIDTTSINININY